MRRIDLIFVGGFLGAGKTTLLHTAARTLSRRGRRVGLVTNDQAPQLFDTALLGAAGPVAEVAGQCFCCGLDDLLGALDSLAEQGVDCILAEPVGSCTDLSATLLQPLKDRHGERFRLAPLTVLADPDRLLDALEARSSDLHEATAYIYGLQLEEADRILVTKSDSLDEGVGDAIVGLTRQAYSVPVDAIAAASGEGVAQWLDATLAGGPVGARILDIDYDRYALGEAVMGWLNATVRVSAATHTAAGPAGPKHPGSGRRLGRSDRPCEGAAERRRPARSRTVHRSGRSRTHVPPRSAVRNAGTAGAQCPRADHTRDTRGLGRARPHDRPRVDRHDRRGAGQVLLLSRIPTPDCSL